MPKRIRRDHPNFELRNARVRVARKEYECAICTPAYGMEVLVACGEVYARTSETRLPVCSAHFTLDDVTETDR